MNSIGLDLGTSAVKGVCWSPEKGILKKISERIDLQHPAENHTELDAGRYFQQIWRIICELSQAADEPIAGIAFAAASGNTLLCSSDGEPLTPIISWLDNRMPDFMPPAEWQVRETSGWPPLSMFTLMHLEYFKRFQPDLMQKSTVAMNNDFVLWKLCGKHLLDSSNATPFYLWNQSRNRWADYLSYYELKESQLPEIVPTGTVAGKLKTEFIQGNLTAKTTLVTGSFDHPAAARAVNVLTPGNMLLSCGTSWVGFYPVKQREDVPDNELCDIFQAANGGCWGAMFSLAQVGLEVEEFVVQRYGNITQRYELFNEEALAGSNAAENMMKSVIMRFKEKFDQHCNMQKIVICGGPSEGKAWRYYLEKYLNVAVENSPYASYTGAVGAAKIAGGLIK